jgi:hypothetical protein
MNWDELLVDYHMNRLDDRRREELEARFRSDKALHRRSLRLGRTLRPLDSWTVAAPPPGLIDRILERAHSGVFRAGRGRTPSWTAGRTSSRRFMPLRELLAVAACLALLLSAMLPGLSRARSLSRRVECANNLGHVHRALGLYRTENMESLPYAGEVPGASWLPDGPEEAPFASNSRHLFRLLLADSALSPDRLVCPFDDSAAPMTRGEVSRRSDFASSRNVSYDSMNLSGPSPNLRPSAMMPYLSDANPLFIGGRFNRSLEPESANSPAHRDRSQTVLTLDGAVMTLTSPMYGGARPDCLWTIRGIDNYTGLETQREADDAFMIPGFPVPNP